MEREPLPASLLPAPGGTWAFTGLSPTRLIGYARHGGTGATEEKTPGTGPGATEEMGHSLASRRQTRLSAKPALTATAVSATAGPVRP